MAIFKDSPVWTMSTETLVDHLASIDAPDRVYWDSRALKQSGQKFQKLAWSHWPKPAKIDGVWHFAAVEAPAPAVVVEPVAAPVVVAPKKPVAAPAPSAEKIVDEAAVIGALEAVPGTAVAEWALAGCPHPAPEAILLAKNACGAGWTKIQRAAIKLSQQVQA